MVDGESVDDYWDYIWTSWANEDVLDWWLTVRTCILLRDMNSFSSDDQTPINASFNIHQQSLDGYQIQETVQTIEGGAYQKVLNLCVWDRY